MFRLKLFRIAPANGPHAFSASAVVEAGNPAAPAMCGARVHFDFGGQARLGERLFQSGPCQWEPRIIICRNRDQNCALDFPPAVRTVRRICHEPTAFRKPRLDRAPGASAQSKPQRWLVQIRRQSRTCRRRSPGTFLIAIAANDDSRAPTDKSSERDVRQGEPARRNEVYTGSAHGCARRIPVYNSHCREGMGPFLALYGKALAEHLVRRDDWTAPAPQVKSASGPWNPVRTLPCDCRDAPEEASLERTGSASAAWIAARVGCIFEGRYNMRKPTTVSKWETAWRVRIPQALAKEARLNEGESLALIRPRRGASSCASSMEYELSDWFANHAQESSSGNGVGAAAR